MNAGLPLLPHVLDWFLDLSGYEGLRADIAAGHIPVTAKRIGILFDRIEDHFADQNLPFETLVESHFEGDDETEVPDLPDWAEPLLEDLKTFVFCERKSAADGKPVQQILADVAAGTQYQKSLPYMQAFKDWLHLPPQKRKAILSTMVDKPGRRRRTREATDILRGALVTAAEEEKPVTCRRLFYVLVSQGLIAKTEKEDKNVVIRLLTELREGGALPFEWIVDHTRSYFKPYSSPSLRTALKGFHDQYRRDIWSSYADAYVEIWVEKKGLIGTLFGVTSDWDVRLVPFGGSSSISFLHKVSAEISQIDKPVFIYYLGDRDPSGVDIRRDAEEKLRRYAPWADIHFKQLAVTPEQIKEYDLPTRPTKETDSRARKFEGESVEVDAIPANELRRLIGDAIAQHLPQNVIDREEKIEEVERQTLAEIIRNLPRRAA